MKIGNGIRLFNEASDQPQGGPPPAVQQSSPAATQAQTPAPQQPAQPSQPAAQTAQSPAQAPQQPPAAAQGAAQQSPAGDGDGQDPDWMRDRFKRFAESQEQKRLRGLGVKSWDEVNAAVEAHRAAEDAKRTQEERNAALNQQVQSTSQQLERTQALVKEQASRMMMALSAEQREAVTTFAGDDPAEQLRAIQHFAPTWAKDERAAEAAAASAAAPQNGSASATQQSTQPTQPATTSPAPGAPASVEAGSPPDHRSVYRSVATRNPFAAAAYGLKHPSVYEKQ